MTQVLQGVRVIELGTMITAPLAGMMLADLSADVLKVEHPQGGDPFRSFRGGLYSPHFVAYNHGKRSIKLDLRSEAGREVLLKLLARADILIENYRAGVMGRLGLGPEVREKTNPRLVHCSTIENVLRHGVGIRAGLSEKKCDQGGLGIRSRSMRWWCGKATASPYQGKIPQEHIEYSDDFEVMQIASPADYRTENVDPRAQS